MSPQTLSEVHEASKSDDAIVTLKNYCLEGWPSKHLVEDCCKPYYSFREELSVINNVLFRNSSIIIPQILR